MVFPSTCYYYCCTAASVARCIREGVALNDRLRNGATKIMPDADVVVTFVWYNTGLCQVSLSVLYGKLSKQELCGNSMLSSPIYLCYV